MEIIKTIIFDMYGVILKESKGNFIPYMRNYFPPSEHDRIKRLIRADKLFSKAQKGEITSDEFLTALGFEHLQFHMRNYIENYLTIDEGFYCFAESRKGTYNYALLSNDVSDWSKYIREFYNLNKYFPVNIISADVRCRKPDARIYEITLNNLGIPASDCIFIDNSVENLNAAREFGIDTILFNRDNEVYKGKTVYSFDELSQIL